jgi:hypothetical protein
MQWTVSVKVVVLQNAICYFMWNLCIFCGNPWYSAERFEKHCCIPLKQFLLLPFSAPIL